MKILLSILNLLPKRWIQGANALRGKYPLIKRFTDWVPNMLRNQNTKILNGLGKGLKFNCGNSAVGFMFGTHDLDVQFALKKLLRPNMVCYDIGANVGFTAIISRKCVGSGGEVVCFEPMVENAKQIKINSDLNDYSNVKVCQVALGDVDGEAEFQVSFAPTWGRLSNAGFTPEKKGTTKVPLFKLDTLVPLHNFSLPGFIKMDVEGAEEKVLYGSQSVIQRALPVMIIEIHHTFKEVAELLKKWHYSVEILTQTPDTVDVDGEFQIIAFPAGNSEVAEFIKEFHRTKEFFFN